MNNNATILAVDDTHESLTLLSEILTSAGYAVRSAHSSELALASVAANPPNLILLNIRMAAINGLEVCRRFKADETTKDIPIILISSYADRKDWVTGLQLGAADYISKPFQAEELLARVKAHLGLNQVNIALKLQGALLLQINEQLHAEIAERKTLENELRLSLYRAESSREEMLKALKNQLSAESQLRESQSFLADLVENSGSLMFVKDREGRYLLVNHKWEQVTHLHRQDVLGKTDEMLFPGPSGSQFRLNDLDVMHSGTAIETEEFLDNPEGGLYFISIKFPLRDGNGNITGICGMATEITDRKKAEMERVRLLYILESILNEIYVFNPDTLIFEYVNRAACRNLGYSMEALRNMTPLDLKPEFTEASFRQTIKPLLEGEQQQLIFETVHRRADGSLYSVEVHLQLIDLEGQPVFLAVIKDITERKRARAELERLKAAIEQVGEVIVITDPQGAIQYANPAFEKTTGYTFQEVFQQNPRLLKSGVHDEAFYDELWETISRGRTWKGRLVNKHKNGTLYTEETTISPVFDSKGKIINYIAVKRDLTENLKLEAQFIQAQKMESVGRLTGGVAHDFNNILSVILGYTDMALEKADPSQKIHGYLKTIRDAALRSTDIVRQLLAFSRQQAIAPKVLDLNETVQNMLHILRRLIGEGIDLAWTPAPHLASIKMDPTQIDQILANLCVNARDAINGIGNITIATNALTLDEQFFANKPEVMPGDYVVLSVSDDGCGMAEAIIDKIFEPFFTTKDIGQGTGLGLATVYGIVKQNKGIITVDSKTGEGSTFMVYLPCYHGEAISKGVAQAPFPESSKGETLLLVEDDPSILAMGLRMLEKLGYRVLSAGTPNEALRMVAEYDGTIDLLITDVIMPEMNGLELSKRLLALHPELKLLYMSGYTADIIGPHGVLDEGVNFLPKPFSRQELSAKIRTVLES